MSYSKENAKKWKLEQIEYFKLYLEAFDNNSKEYSLIKKGIKKLEKSL